jgi:hypothetical protein
MTLLLPQDVVYRPFAPFFGQQLSALFCHSDSVRPHYLSRPMQTPITYHMTPLTRPLSHTNVHTYKKTARRLTTNLAYVPGGRMSVSSFRFCCVDDDDNDDIWLCTAIYKGTVN